MSHYTGTVPDVAARPTDWLATAPCKEDPEAMFPGSLAHEIETAKAYCRACPAIQRCRDWAINEREIYGVWGGLDEDERWAIFRQNPQPHPRTPQTTGPRPPAPASLAELVDRSTTPQPGGHLVWTGRKTPEFKGRQFTPNRLAFLVDRGREPNGAVHRMCEVDGCVAHLADTPERGRRAPAVKAAA